MGILPPTHRGESTRLAVGLILVLLAGLAGGSTPSRARAAADAGRFSRPRLLERFDADNDGRMNEDGPEDLNGDGLITVMRVLDPLGAFDGAGEAGGGLCQPALGSCGRAGYFAQGGQRL